MFTENYELLRSDNSWASVGGKKYLLTLQNTESHFHRKMSGFNPIQLNWPLHS